ncbi:hypothetical protein ABK040_014231 [Willaertia magna]
MINKPCSSSFRYTNGSLLLVLLGCIFFLTYFINNSYQGPLIGIDLGSRWLKVGIAKIGTPIDLVLNEQSKRKTSNIIGFRDEDRYIGESAYNMVGRFPEKMIRFLNLVFGKNYDKQLEETLKRFNELKIPIQLVKSESGRGTMDVKFSNNVIYSPEELLAMIFNYIRQLTDEKGTGSVVGDAVITIPHYLSMAQRQAILDAASISGINVLSLMHDHTATALQYGIKNLKKIKEMTKEYENVVFYDIGSTSLTVSAVQYSPPPKEEGKKASSSLGLIKVLGYASDESLGGSDVDGVLVDHFAKKFIEKYNNVGDPRTNARSLSRLVEESQKVKHVLSANNEAFLNVENLFKDRDLHVKITREEFETLVKPLLERSVKTIEKALSLANITIKQVDSFEMSGGSSRIPILQDYISKSLGINLSFSLNADEAIALGSSYYGVMLSPSFSMKNKFKLIDVAPYEINFVLSKTGDKEPKELPLFVYMKDKLEETATITVPRTEDFTITVKYAPDSLPLGYSTEDGLIAQYEVNGVEKAMSEWKFDDERGKKKKVRVVFKLNSNGFVTLDSATALLEETVTVRVDPPASNDTKSETEAKPTYKKDIKTTKVDLEVKVTDLSLVKKMTPEQIIQSKERVKKVESYEQLKRRISAARNTLESTLYGTRDSIFENDNLRPYYTQQDKNAIIKVLEQVEEWLNDYSDDEVNESQVTLYKDKLSSITSLTNPIIERYNEFKKRKEAITFCTNIFNSTIQAMKYMKENQKHITEEELNELNNFLLEKQNFLKDSLARQAAYPSFETPIITAKEIQTECSKLTEKTFQLARKPKPEPEVKITPENTNVDENNNAEQQQQSKESTEEQQQEEQPKKDEL